jgi:hypothetical protein
LFRKTTTNSAVQYVITTVHTFLMLKTVNVGEKFQSHKTAVSDRFLNAKYLHPSMFEGVHIKCDDRAVLYVRRSFPRQTLFQSILSKLEYLHPTMLESQLTVGRSCTWEDQKTLFRSILSKCKSTYSLQCWEGSPAHVTVGCAREHTMSTGVDSTIDVRHPFNVTGRYNRSPSSIILSTKKNLQASMLGTEKAQMWRAIWYLRRQLHDFRGFESFCR